MDVQNFILISLFCSYSVRGAMGSSISFRTLCKNCYNMQTCNLIASIFGTNEECVTVDSRAKFVVNLRNVQGVMSISSRKKKIKLLSQLQGKPSIKTHGSVSCGPRSRRATPVSILTGRTKTSFSHLCISVITYPIGTKFATQLPASQGSLHSKFEGNRSGHFRDTSCQSFVFFSSFFISSSSSFRTLAKIAITSKPVLRSP